VTAILNNAASMGLVESTVMVHSKPIRTVYRATNKGKNILYALHEIEKEIC
jgi:DNA-binding PadR family transcriptional regulator